MAGSSTFHQTCPMVGPKVVQTSSLPFALEWPFFWLQLCLKAPALTHWQIGRGTTLAVAIAIIAAYCLATHGVGNPTHPVAPVEGNWYRAS